MVFVLQFHYRQEFSLTICQFFFFSSSGNVIPIFTGLHTGSWVFYQFKPRLSILVTPSKLFGAVFSFSRANKAEPSSAAVSQCWAEGHLILIFLQEKGITGVRFHLLLCSLGVGKALRASGIVQGCRRSRRCWQSFLWVVRAAGTPPQSARRALLLGLLHGEGSQGWKDTLQGNQQPFTRSRGHRNVVGHCK